MVAVGLRPEHFSRDADVPAEQRMRVTVDLVETLGSDVLLHFTTKARPIVTEDVRDAVDDEDAFAELEQRAREGGQSFTARIEPKNVPKVGAEIELGFRTEEMHFFDFDTGDALRTIHGRKSVAGALETESAPASDDGPPAGAHRPPDTV